MAILHRYVVRWTGLTDLPGVSVHYCDSTTAISSELQAFFTACKNWFPNALNWSFAGSGDALDEASGHLTGSFADTTFSVNGFGGGGTYVSGTGTYVQWGTADVGAHRRIKGRTYLLPLITSAFTNAGGIDSGALAAFNTAASGIISAENVRVWHRPPKGATTGGSSHLITTASVSNQVSSLRSRRR